MRPGAGRKPKPVDEKQSRDVSIALTEAEYEALRQAADGMPLGTFTRRIVLRSLAQRRK
jgi:hypothetical protein